MHGIMNRATAVIEQDEANMLRTIPNISSAPLCCKLMFVETIKSLVRYDGAINKRVKIRARPIAHERYQ